MVRCQSLIVLFSPDNTTGLRSLDAELEEIVRIERHGGAKSAMEVAAAVEQIQNLKTAIARVSVSAHQAEVAVSDATRYTLTELV